jgi:hypothetical protein
MKTKSKILIYPLIIMGFILMLTISCKKTETPVVNKTETMPVLTTSILRSITSNSASFSSNITSDGGSTIIVKGVCWSKVATPTISDNKTMDGVDGGSFTSTISGLSPKTTYRVRSYATNAMGTSYSNEISFKTLLDINSEIDGIVHPIENWSQQ